MSLPPVLVLHISAATVGLLSGYLAIVLRKGSTLHGLAGNVYFPAMLTMSATAVYIAAFLHPIALNVIVGLLTFYLVSTAWRAARRREGGTTRVDVVALLFVIGVAVAALAFGVEAVRSPDGAKDGMPAFLYFLFGSFAVLSVVSDVRMFRRGGATGPHRIARHLYRMCFALLIATFSFYPGQAKLFPDWLRETNVLMAPHLFLLGSILFWRFRVMRGRRVAESPSRRVFEPTTRTLDDLTTRRLEDSTKVA